jgi:Tfp pilus assembly protein PilF
MMITLFAMALLAAPPSPSVPAAANHQNAEQGDLAAQNLIAGREEAALATLERAVAADPSDPAVQINLGIAYARLGKDAEARAAFEAALASDEVVELDTADGTATDSRRLARKAIRMLERGELRVDPQLTYRN